MVQLRSSENPRLFVLKFSCLSLSLRCLKSEIGREMMRKVLLLLCLFLGGACAAPSTAQLPAVTDSSEAQIVMSDTSGTSEPLSVSPLVTSGNNGYVYELTWNELSDWFGLPESVRALFTVFGWLFASVGPVGGWMVLGLPHWTNFCSLWGMGRLLLVLILAFAWWQLEQRYHRWTKNIAVSSYASLQSAHSSLRWSFLLMIAGLILSAWGILLCGVLILLRALWHLSSKKRNYLQDTSNNPFMGRS